MSFLKYGKLLSIPKEWENHYRSCTKNMEPDKKRELNRLVYKNKYKQSIRMALSQQLIEDIGCVDAPPVTKHLAVDFWDIFFIADDHIDEKGEEGIKDFQEVVEKRSGGSGVMGLVGDWLDSLSDYMGEKYDRIEKIIPGGVEYLKMEMNADTKEETLESRMLGSKELTDFFLNITESYSDEEFGEQNKGIYKLGYMINIIDDLADMKEDYGKKKTFPILRYEELKEKMPKSRAIRKVGEEVTEMAEEAFHEGLCYVKGRNHYRFLGNMMSMAYNFKMKKNNIFGNF